MAHSRYIVGATPRLRKAEMDYWPEARETMDVIVETDETKDTGLVDQHRLTIYRVPERRKVGF